MTLSRFMIEATRSNPDHADFESLLASIQIACKTIANLVSRAGVSDLTGIQASSKSFDSGTPDLGDSDLSDSLYEMANTVLKNSLRFTGKIGVVAPVEDGDQPLLVEEAWNSKYVAVFDALDGSSNIDVGIVTGTIFGIFKGECEDDSCLVDYGDEVSEEGQERLIQTLQPKTNLVAAGYCMYSSSTVLMFSMGEGVHGFTLDPSIGEFVLTHPNVKIPPRGRIYSLNEANTLKWPKGLQQYVSNIKAGKGELGLSYTARYIGSMVGDVHRTLLYGGIFGYPADSKRPRGKLRMLHEVSPLSFLIEQAGGKASTGTRRIMDEPVRSLHDHVPCIMGSRDDVTEVEKYIKSDRG
eukprot:CAMPEP_0119036334 /NCGR_PEP_ID=MMETSP1177-20130426/3994_1 /TAXON_ID=2985 /ORGANISM="Ochromonas sp, Strain CCMP1899" /LENGTH=352 /DNA_ID=CAMNT_0006996071 /DNA_START=215 /DNA_END=1273 /DNA_ORIENTATION=-